MRGKALQSQEAEGGAQESWTANIWAGTWRTCRSSLGWRKAFQAEGTAGAQNRARTRHSIWWEERGSLRLQPTEEWGGGRAGWGAGRRPGQEPSCAGLRVPMPRSVGFIPGQGRTMANVIRHLVRAIGKSSHCGCYNTETVPDEVPFRGLLQLSRDRKVSCGSGQGQCGWWWGHSSESSIPSGWWVPISSSANSELLPVVYRWRCKSSSFSPAHRLRKCQCQKIPGHPCGHPLPHFIEEKTEDLRGALAP